MRSSAVRGNFTSGRRPLGSSSSVLKVPNADDDDDDDVAITKMKELTLVRKIVISHSPH